MRIYPIKTNTFNYYNKSVNFKSNPNTTTTPVQTADVAELKTAGAKHKSHSRSFVSKLNEFFSPPAGYEKTDPRYSESPWIRAFLY